MDEYTLKQSLKNTKVSDYPSEAFSYYNLCNSAFKKAIDYDDYYQILQHSSIDFLKDKIEDIIIYGHIGVEDIPDILLNDRDVAILLTKKQLHSMDFLSFNLRDDEEFINEIAQVNGHILKYASTRIKNIDYILENAISATPDSLQFVPENKKNIDLCDFALFNNDKRFPEVWQYIPEYLNKEWYMKSIGKKVPQIYQYIDEKIKEDINFTNSFLENSDILEFAPNSIKDNSDCIELACANRINDKHGRWYNFKFASDRLKNDPDFVWKIIKNDPNQLFFCGNQIKNDINIALKIHSPNSPHAKKNILEFFNEKVKKNEAVAMSALKFDSNSAIHISHKLKNNKEFLMNYIEQPEFKSNVLQYFSIELRNDYEIMFKATKKNSSSLIFLGNNLKFSTKFLKDITENIETDVFNIYMKSLNFKEGEELPFLTILRNKYNEEYLSTMNNNFFLEFIKDNAFYNYLNFQPNIYEYLNRFDFFDKLDNEVNDKIFHHKKKI